MRTLGYPAKVLILVYLLAMLLVTLWNLYKIATPSEIPFIGIRLSYTFKVRDWNELLITYCAITACFVVIALLLQKAQGK